MERTESQIREHYELEVFLADKLRNSKKEERAKLYAEVYNELFSKIKHHPQLTRKISEEESQSDLQKQLGFLNRFLNKETTYLEIGAGDCKLAFEVAKLVKNSIAIDVSETITDSASTPGNFRLILTDGTQIPVPPKSVQVAYSNQLMEHLHEEDAFDQLKNIYQSLDINGRYICITPNRINGPHDVSAHYDEKARGFHLKEYTWLELSVLFRKAGFNKTVGYIGRGNYFIGIHLFPLIIYESLLSLIPRKARKLLSKSVVFRAVLFIRLAGIKKVG